MAESTITVPWPCTPLSERQWCRAVEALAEAAEAQVGRRPSLQDQAKLALAFAGLLWPALSPELVAGSCRASLLLGAPGVVLSSAPADQAQEIAERLDRIWQQAQHDPSAAVATVAPPLLDLPPTAPRRTGRPAKAQEPAPAPPEPAAPDPEPEPDPDPEPEAPPPAAPAPEPIPPDWFTGQDLAQLLETSATTLSRWRKAGRCGEQGRDWLQVGRKFHYAPQLAERLLMEQQAQPQPPRVDAPLADPLADPARWLTTAEVAAVFGLSEPWVARARRLGVLQEGEHCFRIRRGEFPSEPRRKGWRYDREPAIAALAAASGRPVPAIAT